jgi:hypothetical protein
MSDKFDFSDLDQYDEPQTESEFDFSDLDKYELPNPEQSKMSAAESALLGAGDSAALGLSPVLAGIAGAGVEVAEDIGDTLGLTTDADLRSQGFKVEDENKGIQGLLDAYYSSRDRARNLQKQAFDEQTGAYLVGSLAGGIGGAPLALGAGSVLSKVGLAGKATSKLLPSLEGITKAQSIKSKLGTAAIEGAKAGALAGFGQGEGKLLGEDRDISKTLTETATSSLGGAALGGTFSAAGQALSGTDIGKAAKSAFDYGRRGKFLTKNLLNEDVNKLSKIMYNRFATTLKKAGLNKGKILNTTNMMANELGQGKNLDEAFESTINKIDAIGSMNDTDLANLKTAAIDALEELKGSPKAIKKLEEQVEKTRLTKMMRDVEDEASIRLQKQSDIDSIKRNQSPDFVKERIEKSSNLNRKNLKYKVRDEDYFDVTKEKFPGKGLVTEDGIQLEDLSDEDVIVKAFSKKRVSDATPFDPTETISGIDPNTGRPFAAYKDKGTGKIYGKIGDPLETNIQNIENATAKDLQGIIDGLNARIKEHGKTKLPGVLETHENIKYHSKKLIEKLKKVQESMVATEGYIRNESLDLNSANKTYHEIKNAVETVGINPKPLDDLTTGAEADIRKLEKLITGTGDETTRLRRDFIKRLKKADPQFGGRLADLTEEISNLRSSFTSANVDGTISGRGAVREILGGVTKIATSGANIAGLGRRGLVDAPARAAEKALQRGMTLSQDVFRKLSPKGYDTVAKILDNSGMQNFGNQIREMANSNDVQKLRTLYALYQQPGFRSVMRDVGNLLMDEDE